MKKILYQIWIILIAIFLNLNGRIIEIKNMSELPKYTNEPNTLVIFDIDNTILEPTNELGSDQWFSACVKKEIDSGLNKIEAINKVVPSYIAAQQKAKVKLVEPQTSKIISSLQKQKIPMLALTARGIELSNCTFSQLKSIKVNLSLKSPWKKELTFSDCPFQANYRNGIIFCTQNNKGQILNKFLDMTAFKPSKIVFIDDRKSHLEDVEKELENTKISFIGLRYSYLDEKVNRFVLREDAQNKTASASFFTMAKNKLSSLGNNMIALQ